MKKILLISTNALGDTYLTCSAFNLLKNHFGKVRIDIISTESAEFFLKEIGFDNLFLVKKKSFTEMRKLIMKLRNERYDFVFNFFPGQMNSSFLKLSDSVEKIGFTNFIKKKSWHNDEDVLKIKSQPKNNAGLWKPEDNYLERITLCLNSLGMNDQSIKKHLFNFKNADEENFDIVLHLFSSETKRKINIESIKEVALELSYFKKVCIIGDKNETEQLKDLQKIKNLRIEVSPEIKKLTNLISGAELFIGVDSFPIHIADAYDVKVIGIFYYANEKSVFQSMHNKFIYRVNDSSLKASELINFIKEKKLLKDI